MKTCKICKIEKDDKDFRPKRLSCRKCVRLTTTAKWNKANADKVKNHSKSNYLRNREVRIQRAGNWAKNNNDKRLKIQSKYRIGNSNTLNEKGREYYIDNKDRVLAYHALKYKRDKEKISKRIAIYRSNNRGHMIKKGIEYHKNRRESDPTFKIRCYLSNRINIALRKYLIGKAFSTMKLTGCSTEELKNHLESLFIEDMSWDNYGTWHIDHKKPCASFDLSDPEQQKICFHYTNLQPLWAIDNFKKSSKLMTA